MTVLLLLGDGVTKSRKSVLHQPFIDKMTVGLTTKNADTLTSLGKSGL